LDKSVERRAQKYETATHNGIAVLVNTYRQGSTLMFPAVAMSVPIKADSPYRGF
jgi:hypothetical protein